MEEKQPINTDSAPPPYPSAPPSAMPMYQPPYQVPPPGQASYPIGYNAPPPTYQSNPPAGGYVVGAPMMAAPTVIVQHNFSDVPAACVCPNCHKSVVTNTQFEVGLFTWLIVGIIFICGGWIFCLCFLPFCIDGLKDVRHTCPNCNYTIHLKKRM